MALEEDLAGIRDSLTEIAERLGELCDILADSNDLQYRRELTNGR